MKVLKFKNPSFKRGLNFTVRKGSWAKDVLNIGKRIKINSTINEAEISHIFTCKYKDIPKIVFKNEHDKTCRTRRGLEKELRRIYYPLKGLRTINDLVFTCLGFYIKRR